MLSNTVNLQSETTRSQVPAGTVAIPVGFEPTTLRLEGGCSIH